MNLLNDDISFPEKCQNNSFDESSGSLDTPKNSSPTCSNESTLNTENGLIQLITSIACKNTTYTSAFMTSPQNIHDENEKNATNGNETVDQDPLQAKLERKLTEKLKKEIEMNELTDEIQKLREEINQRHTNHYNHS